MTIAAFQVATVYMEGDLAVKNYGVTDIPAGVGVNLDTGHLISSGVVTDDSIGVVVPTASATVIEAIGVTLEVIKAGGTGRVRTTGTVEMIANGTVTADDCVMVGSTTAKLGWGATQTTGLPQIGKALSTATNGNTFLLLISKAFNH